MTKPRAADMDFVEVDFSGKKPLYNLVRAIVHATKNEDLGMTTVRFIREFGRFFNHLSASYTKPPSNFYRLGERGYVDVDHGFELLRMAMCIGVDVRLTLWEPLGEPIELPAYYTLEEMLNTRDTEAFVLRAGDRLREALKVGL